MMGFEGPKTTKYGYKLWGSEITGDWIRVKKMGRKKASKFESCRK